MEEWLKDFQPWFREEDDLQDFAQQLLQEFPNWFVEEDTEPGLSESDIKEIVQGLYPLVEKAIQGRIEAEENCQFAQAFCQEFRNWKTQTEEDQEFALILCKEFSNWVTVEEEAAAYAEIFLNQHFTALPLDIIRAVRKKVWKQETLLMVPFGLNNTPKTFRRYWNDRYFHLFHARGHCLMMNRQQLRTL